MWVSVFLWYIPSLRPVLVEQESSRPPQANWGFTTNKWPTWTLFIRFCFPVGSSNILQASCFQLFWAVVNLCPAATWTYHGHRRTNRSWSHGVCWHLPTPPRPNCGSADLENMPNWIHFRFTSDLCLGHKSGASSDQDSEILMHL